MTKRELSQVYYLSREIAERPDAAERLEAERDKILRYIDGIGDSLTRQIMVKRHVELKSWRRIAKDIGGGNTADGIRKMHDRYLRREKKEEGD